MRIGYDGRGLDGRLTGAAKAFLFLLRQLRADFPAHAWVALAPRRPAPWRLPRQLLWEQVELPLRARHAGVDLLHVASAMSAPVTGGIRVVMTVHDLAPTRHPEYLPTRRSRWYWGRWVPFTARRARRVIAPSESTRRDLVTLAAVAPERVAVIPLAAPLDRTAAGPAELERVRQAHGLPARYLLYVGTVDRRKDLPALLEALTHLDPDLHLVVAGTVIAGRTDFAERVARLGLVRRVRLLGYVPDDDLPGLYAAAAAFVYPSFYEGFGLPVLEAMACGAPVVTYATTSLPEVAGDAAVLLHPPVAPAALAEAIRGLLADEGARRALVARGLARVRRFDWRTTARLTMEVYASVVGD